MNVSSKHLKANKFGCWVMVIGIIEYIFGPKHVLERVSALELEKDGLHLGMDRHAWRCDGVGFTKNLFIRQGGMHRSSLCMKMLNW